jgi:glutaredoxin
VEKNYLILGVIAVVIIAAYVILANAPGAYDSFGKCVGASGAKMYGASWCPHCNDQKHLFGNSWRFVDYVECSTPDGKGETDVCKAANVTSYPTWIFADGSKNLGAMTFEELAARTNCTFLQ